MEYADDEDAVLLDHIEHEMAGMQVAKKFGNYVPSPMPKAWRLGQEVEAIAQT
jgi:hypothetical protein